MDEIEFEKLIQEAIDSLPAEFGEKLNNVAVTVEDFPSFQQLKRARVGQYGILFGLYEGVPQTKRGIYYSHIPDKITIFKNSIERVSNSPLEIKEKVREVLIHEIGHHFGLSDQELSK